MMVFRLEATTYLQFYQPFFVNHETEEIRLMNPACYSVWEMRSDRICEYVRLNYRLRFLHNKASRNDIASA
jgi:hypothetical protein